MTADQLRRMYLDFFAGKGHAVITGSSLIPQNDPTVLFTTAGMHPLVPYLLGEPHPAGKRLCNCQKCIRTGDIDEVGDASHLTFFEMLGNWSLGDYFKEEAIAWSFEFLTSPGCLGFKPGVLNVTVFEGNENAPRDEESIAIWKKLGIPESRIFALPMKEPLQALGRMPVRRVASDLPWAVTWHANKQAVWLPPTRAGLDSVAAVAPVDGVLLSPDMGVPSDDSPDFRNAYDMVRWAATEVRLREGRESRAEPKPMSQVAQEVPRVLYEAGKTAGVKLDPIPGFRLKELLGSDGGWQYYERVAGTAP